MLYRKGRKNDWIVFKLVYNAGLMRRAFALLAISMTSLLTFGQAEDSPSAIAKAFLQSTFVGDLVRAEMLSNRLVIADGKTYGAKSERSLEQALRSLQASGYEYHKEMSAEITDHRAKVLVEMVRRNGEITDIDIFETLLIPTATGWKIFGWRKITPPVELVRPRRPIQPLRPFSFPKVRPCPSCVRI